MADYDDRKKDRHFPNGQFAFKSLHGNIVAAASADARKDEEREEERIRKGEDARGTGYRVLDYSPISRV